MKSLNFSLLFLLFSSSYLSAQVDYIEINIENINIGNLLTWTTATEKNNAHFIVEKSVDGQTFEVVFTCEGQLKSATETTYTFLDANANELFTFYRIKDMATDGTYSYTELMQVQQQFTNYLSIEHVSDLANPNNKGLLYLELTATKAGLLIYTVENEKTPIGAPIELFVEIGLTPLSLDFSDLPKGHYSVNFNLDGETESILINKINDAAAIEVTARNDGAGFGKYRED